MKNGPEGPLTWRRPALASRNQAFTKHAERSLKQQRVLIELRPNQSRDASAIRDGVPERDPYA